MPLLLLLLLPSMQGEDVVAGIRTPDVIERLRDALPEAYTQLIANCELLEQHYKDMQVRTLVPLEAHSGM
jgi:phosphoenolpyruvate synthase/pyruvate phosphate dikinase